MKAEKFDRKTFVRRTKFYVSANREEFITKPRTGRTAGGKVPLRRTG